MKAFFGEILRISKHTWMVLTLIILLLIGYQYPYAFDLTHHRYNSLIPAAEALLSSLREPLNIELVSADPDIRKRVQQTLALFQTKSPAITCLSTRTHLDPAEKTRLGLDGHHHLLLKYQDQLKAIDLDIERWGQKYLTQAIYPMLRRNQTWTVFLQGHGEADPFGKDNKGLYHLSKDLKNKGIRIAALNLGHAGLIPDNTQLLVMADPRSPLLAKELQQIKAYVEKGGNLLWLAGATQPAGLQPLAKLLGVHWPSGLIIDPKSHALGTPDPGISLVMDYPPHPLNTMNQLTVFPWSTPIEWTDKTLGWESEPFLLSNEQTYLADQPKKKGPFKLGISLRKGKQRVVLLGSPYAFNNATLHNYGNLKLANNLFNWLNEADLFLTEEQPSKSPPHTTPSRGFYWMVRFVFPYGLSLVYALISLPWWRFRRPKAYRVPVAYSTI